MALFYVLMRCIGYCSCGLTYKFKVVPVTVVLYEESDCSSFLCSFCVSVVLLFFCPYRRVRNDIAEMRLLDHSASVCLSACGLSELRAAVRNLHRPILIANLNLCLQIGLQLRASKLMTPVSVSI